jgi:hypothetical protein
VVGADASAGTPDHATSVNHPAQRADILKASAKRTNVNHHTTPTKLLFQLAQGNPIQHVNPLKALDCNRANNGVPTNEHHIERPNIDENYLRADESNAGTTKRDTDLTTVGWPQELGRVNPKNAQSGHSINEQEPQHHRA